MSKTMLKLAVVPFHGPSSSRRAGHLDQVIFGVA